MWCCGCLFCSLIGTCALRFKIQLLHLKSDFMTLKSCEGFCSALARTGILYTVKHSVWLHWPFHLLFFYPPVLVHHDDSLLPDFSVSSQLYRQCLNILSSWEFCGAVFVASMWQNPTHSLTHLPPPLVHKDGCLHNERLYSFIMLMACIFHP